MNPKNLYRSGYDDIDQPFLLPTDMREWLSEKHLVYFIMEVAGELDLGSIHCKYDGRKGGNPAYHPQMMVALLTYAYCVGMPSSRKIEKATYEMVPFRVISGGSHPDHDTVADFRKRHLKELAGLFVQVLRLCQKAGLVKLGHVALDGTKLKANASKHKAMSYDRMEKSIGELEREVADLLKRAESVDEEEDKRYGKGKKEEDLPERLRFKEDRLKKIREAKAELEEEARERAKEQQKEYEEKKKAWEDLDKKKKGRVPVAPTAEVKPKAQRNFTDSESRIMKDGSSKSFEQAYNAQAVVDGKVQVIVATGLSQETNDKKQLLPMMAQLKENVGEFSGKASADAGYFSETNVLAPDLKLVDLYIPPDRQKHGEEKVQVLGRPRNDLSVADRMRRKLRTKAGYEVYRFRKAIVEPVFGQIKHVRGFRRFSFRGKENVRPEWDMICLTHNLLKLFRYDWLPQTV